MTFLTRSLLGLSLLVAGCSSHTPDAPCVPKIAPPSAPALRLKLSKIDFGDRGGSGTTSTSGWRTIGFDLDGQCTTRSSTTACRRRASAPSSFQEDGDDGIDNSFGRIMIPLAAPFFGRPSDKWSGESVLDIHDDGTGTLSLIGDGAWIRVPLVNARADVHDGAGTLGAIVPLDAWIASFRHDGATIHPDLCGGATLETILETMRDAADMNLGGNEPSVECDGISLGLTFEGTPVDTIPIVPIGCGEGAIQTDP